MGRLLMGMFLTAFLMLAAATIADEGPTRRGAAVRVATATVTIVQAERIAPAVAVQSAPKQDRQISMREAQPLVEFY